MDDDALVARIRSGDFAAASELLSRHQRVAYTAALRLLREPLDAEDVAQEALVRAYTRIAELQSGASFPAWLRRIAVNLSLNLLRRRGVLQIESLDAGAAAGDSGTVPYQLADHSSQTPEQAALDREHRDRIEELVGQLSPEQRVAVVLRDMYGYDVAEVAALQRCGLSAAKMRIARGRAQLRRLLGEERTQMESVS
jgi:RNA polymerase sigma-70 factor (ECF subfamily)